MEIGLIKEGLSILAVLAHYGVKVDGHNRGHCPFHDDKTPSFQVYPETNSYCCFSSNCEAGTGDQIDFIEMMEKQGKHHAILKAKSLLGFVASKEEGLNNLFAKFQRNVSKSSRARAYLKSRHLLEACSQLEIGFNASGYKELQQCLIFPLKNASGDVVSLYGRSLTRGHYYQKGRNGLYPAYPDAQTRKLILTESIIDAATLLSISEIATSYTILALYGTNGLTAEHTKAMLSLANLSEITLFFDGDAAGRAANNKHGYYLQNLFPETTIKVAAPPEGEDVNSLLSGHSPSILLHLLEQSKPITPTSAVSAPAAKTNTPAPVAPALPETSQLISDNPQYLTYAKADLRCVLLGGINIQQIDRLRVTLLLERVPKLNPLHSLRQSGLDLYNDKLVEKFSRSAAEKLETGTTTIRVLLAELIDALEDYRLKQRAATLDKPVTKRVLTAEEEQAAIRYLQAPKLLKRTNEDIGKTGVIGEEVNRLLMYICFTSRLRDTPLHVMSLGASGTGKTYLQEKIAELIPEEDLVEITVLSDNAFYYFKQKELQHKLILIEDLDGLSGAGGSNGALLALRELMSKKRISKRVVVKNSKGNMSTISLIVDGPICVAGTTTQEKIYEDNANRSLLIYRDNSPAHQAQIMAYQRALSARQINHQAETAIKTQFKNMQSLLKPIAVRNPYAPQLHIPQAVFKPLRSNAHYLQFIECITFYHQYQRKTHTDPQTGEHYIETTLSDIAAANQLLQDVLLAKADELSGACRQFFERLKHHLQQQHKKSFYAKEIRQALRISPTTLKRHLYQLYQQDYLKIVGGDRFRKGYEYEVVRSDEYEALQANITTALDDALAQIKAATRTAAVQ